METEIREADPGRQRLAVALVGIVAIAGVIAFYAVQGWLAGIHAGARLDPARYRDVVTKTLEYAVGINCALMLLLGAHVWRVGSNVRKADTFPLPSDRLIRRTKVLRGSAAQTRGRAMQAVGVLLAIASAGLAAMTWRFLSIIQ